MFLKLDENNIVEGAILEISRMIEGSYWENKVFLCGQQLTNKLMGNDMKYAEFAIMDENGGIEFSKFICNKLNCYSFQNNPIFNSADSIYEFKMETIEKYKNITIKCCRSHTIDGSYGSIFQDALRRSATINAIYLNITSGYTADPTGTGILDINNMVIKAPSNPLSFFKEQPSKILEQIRLSCELGFGIEKNTWLGMIANATNIDNMFQYKLTEELTRHLLLDKPSESFRKMLGCGALKYALPIVYNMTDIVQGNTHANDLFNHTMEVVDASPKEMITRWAALLHDMGKVETYSFSFKGEPKFYAHENLGAITAKRMLGEMMFSTSDIKKICEAIKYHMFFKECGNRTPSNKRIKRFMSSVGNDYDFVLDIIDADNKSRSEAHKLDKQVKLIREKIKSLKRQENGKNRGVIPFDGKFLMEQLNLKEGIEVGTAIKTAKEMFSRDPNLTTESFILHMKKVMANL